MLLTIIISILLTLFLIFLPEKWITNERDLVGVQKIHSKPTPRIAGISIFISFFSGFWFLSLTQSDFTQNMYIMLLVVSFPVFLVGLIEDFTFKVSPTIRMLVILISVGIAFVLLDIRIDFLGFKVIDLILSNYVIVSLLFTLLVVGGLVNAINIIDGLNGLVSGYSIFVLLAIAYVSSIVGDDLVLQLSLLLVSSLLGFFIFNFLLGKIFMGDGGAYFVGFMISIIGLMLSINNEGVSHWFVLLLFIYPLYETVFSIYRRKTILDISPYKPDSYHLHMLIYKRLIKYEIFKNNKIMCNSMISPFLWLLSLVGIVPAVIWYDNQTMLILWAFIFMIIYMIIYRCVAHKFKK